VQRAGFVARTNEVDAKFFQTRIQAKIRAVDDAENFLHAFVGEHLRDDFAAGGLFHAEFLSGDMRICRILRTQLPG